MHVAEGRHVEGVSPPRLRPTWKPPKWAVNDMAERLDRDRRRFLGRVALVIGATHAGMFGAAGSKAASQELTAIGRATEWLNSPRLTPEALAGKDGG